MTDEQDQPPTPPEPEGPGEQDAPFDAVAAVAELEAAMAAVDAQSPQGENDRYIETLESDVLELNALLEKKDAAIAAAEARAEHALEEVEKAKARLEGEAARQLERRTRKVLLGFVDVLDELDRALASIRDTAGHAPELLTGIEQVQRRFVTALESHGVRRCPALGQPFDPALHEAVTTTPCPADQDGKVVAVMREGYTVGDDELLRPATVVVGRAT